MSLIGESSASPSGKPDANPGAPADETTPLEGANHKFILPPLRMTTDDLRKLASKVEEYARQAADREVRGYKLLEGQTPEQLEQSKAETLKMLQLWVQVYGDGDNWRAGRPDEVLRDEVLPDVITHVTFDSGMHYRAASQSAPVNAIVINLNFRRRAFLDLRNAAGAAEDNLSTLWVHGSDTAWVDGVYMQLRKFFSERRTLWGWLHGVNTYDALLVTIGFPLIVASVAKAGGIIVTSNAVARWGWLVYVFVLLLYAFRLLFNLMCRVFPRTMGPRSGTGGGFVEGTFVVLTIVGWLSGLFLDRVGQWVSALLHR